MTFDSRVNGESVEVSARIGKCFFSHQRVRRLNARVYNCMFAVQRLSMASTMRHGSDACVMVRLVSGCTYACRIS